MSQLQIRTSNLGNFRLNVLAFSSPIFGSIGGAQTRKSMQWYPVKANQPEIEFDVQFASEWDYETFSKFIRGTHEWSLSAPKPTVYLNWPERNINNWSGIITEFTAGGSRANPAPRAKFTVSLVDSFVSQYTEIGTLAKTFAEAFPIMVRGFSNLIANPYNFRLPTMPSSQRIEQTDPNAPNTVTPTVEQPQQ